MDSTIVWKYELHPGLNWLTLPEGAEPLHVAGQGGTIQMWVRVRRTPEEERTATTPSTKERPFLALFTGEGFYATHVGAYIGTAHTAPETGFPYGIVVHVFEYLP